MLGYRGGELYLDGVSARAVAQRFGTPLYVYSRDLVLERFRALKKAFKARSPLICYALKANSNAALCRALAKAGAGADIVSGGELQRALRAGFKPRRIVFSGVGKTQEEMALALRSGVLTLNVESREELEALERTARRLRIPAPVSVRLNPDVDPGTHPHITTGISENKFGVEAGEALELYEKAVKSPWLKIQGIQCHIGSQITSVEPYLRAARSLARVAARLQKKGIRLGLMDMGGGLGITYDREKPLKLKVLAQGLARILAPWPQARLLLEPGRYLVAEAGVLLTTVLYRKKTARRRFAVVDAAMNDLARPALYGARHPVWPALRRSGPALPMDVVGPVCESGDFLAKGCLLAEPEPGDVLAVLKAGAYGFSMSSQYNSRPRAAEVLLKGGKAKLSRRRETLEDLIRCEEV
ncbi:MAG: diaminopimelate decarboxylase [Elusimicrobia bacterium]|nr:diaminopimelate decarboxylase [Elusimicrobiota bacterium]